MGWKRTEYLTLGKAPRRLSRGTWSSFFPPAVQIANKKQICQVDFPSKQIFKVSAAALLSFVTRFPATEVSHLLNELNGGLQVHTEVNELPVDTFLLVLFLLQYKHVVVEELLQTLVGVVDQQLFQSVQLKMDQRKSHWKFLDDSWLPRPKTHPTKRKSKTWLIGWQNGRPAEKNPLFWFCLFQMQIPEPLNQLRLESTILVRTGIKSLTGGFNPTDLLPKQHFFGIFCWRFIQIKKNN